MKMYWNKRVVQAVVLAASLRIDNDLVSNCYTADLHYCYCCYCCSLICWYYCIPAALDVIECYCCILVVVEVLQQLMFVVVGALLLCCYTAMADYLVDSAENYLMHYFSAACMN